ncbi:MAG: hypothetical protein N3E37_00325, partial [Candidatus Micrarchaeota archaeon]|nr:hypothetical protein [Candidatus Micrarchaeota archaeon]
MLCQLCEFVTKPEFPELQKLLDLNLNKSESCILCKGKANEYINIIKKALEELNKIHPEQKLTLGISSTIHHEILTNENLIITDMKCSFKTLINHLLKEEIKRMDKFVIAVQPQNSQLLLTIDFVSNSVKLTNNHLFILAKYKKYSRNICQNLWICEYCRGKGCEKCNSSGYKYLSIAKICETGIRNVLKIKHFYLHANGREDVDVMTLGNGRYCVLEFKP